MGIQDGHHDNNAAQRRSFVSHLLHDVQALEHMLAEGMIESGVHRIGAEQELFLVDGARRRLRWRSWSRSRTRTTPQSWDCLSWRSLLIPYGQAVPTVLEIRYHHMIQAVRPAWLRWLRFERLVAILPGVLPHPDQTATLVVDSRIARWFGLELFHLLGFRKKRSQAGKLIVSRRWHEPAVFEE